MIDRIKRNTLKLVGAAAVTTLSAKVFSAREITTQRSLVDNTTPPLARLDVDTGHSALNNEIEVVLTNTGDIDAMITQFTPRQLETARGYFDFHAMLEHGRLQVRVGESVRVGLTARRLSGLTSEQKAMSRSTVRETLRRQLTIVTENDAYAAVTVRQDSPDLFA